METYADHGSSSPAVLLFTPGINYLVALFQGGVIPVQIDLGSFLERFLQVAHSGKERYRYHSNSDPQFPRGQVGQATVRPI